MLILAFCIGMCEKCFARHNSEIHVRAISIQKQSALRRAPPQRVGRKLMILAQGFRREMTYDGSVAGM
jgi:hypothetical protein